MLIARLLLIPLIGLMIVAAGCVDVQEPAPPPPAAVQVVQLRDSLLTGDSWPGFDPSAMPLALFDGDSTWLFHHPSPGETFEPVEGFQSTWRMSGRHPAITAHSTAELDGALSTTMLLDSLENDSLPGLAAIAVHEAFHLYQKRHYPKSAPNEGVVFEYPVTDADLLSWRELETLALQDAGQALAREDTAAALTAAGQAVLARDRYNDFVPEDAGDYVRKTELHEGIPFYLEQRARRQDIRQVFARAGYLKAGDVRRRAYITGAAYGFLLDAWLPGWTERVDRRLRTGGDVSLSDMLRSAVSRRGGVLSDPDPDRMKEARQRAGNLVYEHTRRLGRELSTWRREPGYRLVVDAGDRPLFPSGFDPMNMVALESGALFHDRWLRLSTRGASFETLDQRVLTVPAGEHALYQGVKRVERTGLDSPPRVLQHGDTLVLRWPDGELRAVNADLADSSGVMTVRL